MRTSGWTCVSARLAVLRVALVLSAVVLANAEARAATIVVPAGGNLQAAINSAQPGRHDRAGCGSGVRRQFRSASEEWRRLHRHSELHARCRAASSRPADHSSSMRRCSRGCALRTRIPRFRPRPGRIIGGCGTWSSPRTRTATPKSSVSATARARSTLWLSFLTTFSSNTCMCTVTRSRDRNGPSRPTRHTSRFATRTFPRSRLPARTRRPSAPGTRRGHSLSRTTTSKPPVKTCCSAAPIPSSRTSFPTASSSAGISSRAPCRGCSRLSVRRLASWPPPRAAARWRRERMPIGSLRGARWDS